MQSTAELVGIEGIPLITRFKTKQELELKVLCVVRIEGIPLITRFKTFNSKKFENFVERRY